MNLDIKRARETIIKYLLYINVISLIITLYYFSKTFIIVVLSCNILMLGLNKVFKKFEYLIEPLIMSNKIANSINKLAGRING